MIFRNFGHFTQPWWILIKEFNKSGEINDEFNEVGHDVGEHVKLPEYGLWNSPAAAPNTEMTSFRRNFPLGNMTTMTENISA